MEEGVREELANLRMGMSQHRSQGTSDTWGGNLQNYNAVIYQSSGDDSETASL